MATRFINIDRRTPMLMPENIQDWVPENHISRFIVDAVELLDLSSFHINWRGTGSEQYPPAMMLELLIYCYATGRFASRRIEEATYSDVAVRFICANTHPDHDTICKFRTDNRAALSECFVKVLAMAGETGILKKVGGVSVDGTKIKAGASKHAAVSYERAGQMIEQLRLEIDDLIHKAEDADSMSVAVRTTKANLFRPSATSIPLSATLPTYSPTAATSEKPLSVKLRRTKGRRPMWPPANSDTAEQFAISRSGRIRLRLPKTLPCLKRCVGA